MITIQKSTTADTRTCDYKAVTKEQLLESSRQHISDVQKGMSFFQRKLEDAAIAHDTDKIFDIDGFHRDFLTGFQRTEWWDKHRVINRHHLNSNDGVPTDVNLIDVLDYITDCVMAGMGRSGTVTPLQMSPDLLDQAFRNTVELLKKNVQVLG
jgi:hypothetical protein